MSKLAYDGAYQVGATGNTVTSGVGSASIAIPNDSSGNRARFVRLQATGNLYVKFGLAGVTATNNDMLLSPDCDVIVSCKSFSTIAYIQEAVAAKLNITPFES